MDSEALLNVAGLAGLDLPGVLFAGLFGCQPRPFFAAAPGEAARPDALLAGG